MDAWIIPYLFASREFAFKNSFCYIYISVQEVTHFRCGTQDFCWGYNIPDTPENIMRNVMKFVLMLPHEYGKEVLEKFKKEF